MNKVNFYLFKLVRNIISEHSVIPVNVILALDGDENKFLVLLNDLNSLHPDTCVLNNKDIIVDLRWFVMWLPDVFGILWAAISRKDIVKIAFKLNKIIKKQYHIDLKRISIYYVCDKDSDSIKDLKVKIKNHKEKWKY
ncbi:MAG: hypothetical protein Q8880_13410, partial [Bacteroidota bacterium]|nr:hypothetical protein [Bacteroidota bacterium]